MTPFDFLNEINQGKKDLMVDDIDHQVEKQYNPFIINRGLSYFLDTIMDANEMNIRHHLDKKLQNSYLLNIIRKKKRFSKWHKAEKSELLEIVMEFYGYSIKRAAIRGRNAVYFAAVKGKEETIIKEFPLNENLNGFYFLGEERATLDGL